MKRAFDITLLVMVAPLALVIIIIGAAVSSIALRTWPFFRQNRLGEDEVLFGIWKIRTLPPHTPKYALKHAGAPPGRPPRSTAFLRRTKLDELPQLLNVLLGEMSFVGPRPKMPHEHEPVEATYGAVRVTVPQGCTGLWQISSFSHLLPSEHPEFDFLYVANRRFKLDLWIIWRTLLIASRLGPRVQADHLPDWIMRPPDRAEADRQTPLEPAPAD